MLPILLLAACSSQTTTDSSTAPSADSPTWYGDIKPITDSRCARCHEGGLAPSFGDTERIQGLAASIAARVADGTMPPPAPDPTCRDYADADALTLTDDEKALIQAWADGGGQIGDVADDHSTPTNPLANASYDLELVAPTAYEPVFGSDGNDYRCFVLETDNEESMWLQGFGAIIDNPAIVHHVVIYTIGDDVTVSDDPTGFACGGFGEEGWDFFAGWAPGGGPTELAADQGLSVSAHQRFVLQMHYFGDASTQGAVDQSGMGLILREDTPEHAVFVYPLGSYSFTVPADDPDYKQTDRITWPDGYGTLMIVAEFPHMHLLGSQFYMETGKGDDATCVVDAPRWDFHNQTPLVFTEPVVVNAGDQIKTECHWDNSATSPYQFNDPPQDVTWGEDTTNEMCFAFTYGYLDF